MQIYRSLSTIARECGMSVATVTTVAARADIQADGALANGPLIYTETNALKVVQAVEEYRKTRVVNGRITRAPRT